AAQTNSTFMAMYSAISAQVYSRVPSWIFLILDQPLTIVASAISTDSVSNGLFPSHYNIYTWAGATNQLHCSRALANGGSVQLTGYISSRKLNPSPNLRGSSPRPFTGLRDSHSLTC